MSPFRIRQIAVDIGNSGARAVELDNRADASPLNPLRINWRFSHETSASRNKRYIPDHPEWLSELKPFLIDKTPAQWWISSVNRPATDQLVPFLKKFDHCDVRLIGFKDIGMTLDVEAPHRVGIDRLLAAFAAGRIVADDRLIVIQAGTAVTVDLVDKVRPIEATPPQLLFRGGAILPGVPMMLRLLGHAADLLPQLEADDLVQLPELPGKNTEAAMIAGCSSCLIGGVQHLINRYRADHGDHLQVVLSGGDGPLLAPYLTQKCLTVSQLVLQGIRLLAQSGIK